MKFSSRKSFFFVLLFILISAFLLDCATFPNTKAFASQNTNEKNTTEEVKTEVSPISTIIVTLLDNQNRELDDIEEESQLINDYLKTSIEELQKKTQEVADEFRNISLIYQSSKSAPMELSILAKQNRRLDFDINSMYLPFSRLQVQVLSRLEQLANLTENLQGMDKNTVADILKRVATLTRTYKSYETTLKKILPKTEKLLEQIKEANIHFSIEMPKLWLEYYLASSFNVFSLETWQSEVKNIKNIFNTASLTLISELPVSISAWIVFTFRAILALLVQVFLIFVSLKMSILLPPLFHNTWKKSVTTSVPWLMFGLALHYGAWNDGNIYQVIASTGTLFLCYGQISFTWQLFRMRRESETLNVSPFLPMLTTLFVSLVLLIFTPLPLTLSILWFAFLFLFSIRIYRKERSNFPLPRVLIFLFLVLLIISMFITFAGHVRVSILMILLFTCISIGLHQATTCLYVSSLVHEYLPKNGVPALISGLFISIIMPIILLIAMLSPLGWILAFPGGDYLIKNFTNIDFNIGEVSFNAIQVLSILMIFYLTRSLVSVSCNYIDNSWDKNSNAMASLSTPIKTSIIFGLWGLFTLYVLKVVGFSLTSLAVIAGGLSVGIGLGLQGFVQNIFSGFSLIFGQNIREGDVIDVAGILGVVQKVSLRATQVRTYDNAIVFVPNSEFLATTFINWTHNGRMVRCTVTIGVAYGSNLELVMATALETIKKQSNILAYPEPAIFFMDFAASSLDFELRFWIREIDEKLGTLTKVRLALNSAFQENNIEIPFPQTDIHIRTQIENESNYETMNETLADVSSSQLPKEKVLLDKSFNNTK